jgi:phage terminase large subunit-like protein
VFPEIWIIVPEGNGKTTFLGGLGLYFGDYVPSAMIPIGASSREQAEIMYRQAEGFVYRTPGLRDRFKPQEGYRRVKCLRTGGRLQVFAADAGTGDGVLPHLAIIDEPHRQKDLSLYRTWRGKLGKRQGQMMAISTAGEPGTEFEQVRQHMRGLAGAVTSGCHLRSVEGGMVLHDWSVPTDGDVEDLELVAQANPLSSVEALAEKRATPTMTDAHWRRFVCNQAVKSDSAAITEAEWNARKTDDRPPGGDPVWVGLDLGWKWDTTAVVPLWMPAADRRVVCDPVILTPPRDGTSLPPEAVQDALLGVHERNPVHTVVMDENAGGAQLASWIEQTLGARVISHSQGHSAMALAYERWMEALREGWLWHSGDPELAQHVLNAVARVLPGGQTRFDRPARSRSASSQDRRVWDALTAASMVHSVAVGEAQAPVRRARMAFL